VNIEWSAPDENGISTAWVADEDGNRTQWNRDENGWTSPMPSTIIEPSHDQRLTAAGYGAAQRRRYIAESGQDPEYAACQWDDMIVPAAEAAGEIPANPNPYTPAEQAILDAHRVARDEFWAQHPEYDPLSNSPKNQALFKQADEYGDRRAREILRASATEGAALPVAPATPRHTTAPAVPARPAPASPPCGRSR